MSLELRERELGNTALEFLLERLTNGSKLAQVVAQLLPSRRGVVTTLLPPEITLREAQSFRTGGKLPQSPPGTWTIKDGMVIGPVPNTLRELAAKLHSDLMANRQVIGLFENLMARPGDPYIDRLRSRLIFHDAEIYHLLTSGMEFADVLATLKEARSLPDFTGFLAPVSPTVAAEFLAPSVQLREEDIHLFASAVQTVVVGAYDGESYLMWREAEKARHT